ncbi:MAG TPA: peptidylprolyl isomerase [Thermoanaerobaculia bacterium]|nr:peptidylprolyl isomerase [Thermoanaerobaculia bacterium]
MKRCVITLALAAASALPLLAQQNAASAAPAAADAVPKNVVAVINGEHITTEQLERMWNRMGAKMRAQYEKAGNGKLRFLENYVGKRLLLQLAAESEFDKSPDVQAELEAARESALFDLYVREVVAGQIVTEAAMRQFYDSHPTEFVHPEAAKVRIISISTEKHSPSAARTRIGDLMKELYGVRAGSGNDAQAISAAFAAAAQKNSDHPSAAAGGDLGWIGRDGIEPKLSNAIFNMTPGAISGILETEKALNLVLIEDRQEATTERYEAARPGIREYLVAQNTQKVVEALNRATRELRASSKVTLHPENVQ